MYKNTKVYKCVNIYDHACLISQFVGFVVISMPQIVDKSYTSSAFSEFYKITVIEIRKYYKFA